MEDFDITPNKIGESAQRVVDRSMKEARRRDHALLTNEHIFLAFAQVEWDTFAQVMRDLELNPHEILQALEEQLHVVPTSVGRELRVAPATKLVFKLAFHQASRAGRQSIESSDLFSAILEKSQGGAVPILRRHGVEPETFVTRRSQQSVSGLHLSATRFGTRFDCKGPCAAVLAAWALGLFATVLIVWLLGSSATAQLLR